MNATNVKVSIHQLPNVGFAVVKIDETLAREIKDAIEETISAKEKECAKNLAGNLSASYEIMHPPERLCVMALAIANQLDVDGRSAAEQYGVANPRLEVLETWCNVQYKHEFNPPHTHSAAYSFVTWPEIPYTQESEMASAPGVGSNSFSAGAFGFLYPTVTGGITSYLLPIEATNDRSLVVFPAKLTHYVSPFFSSDKRRISVAGNIGVRYA